MKNKKIIVVMLLSMMSGITRPNQSGSAQSGIVIPTKVLVGGIALTGTALWYLKSRSDRLDVKLKQRNTAILKEEGDRQMGSFRAVFYTLGDIASWALGFSSGYGTTLKIFGRSVFGLTQNSKEQKEKDGLQESIGHANFTKFSSQISSGYFSSSECDPNKIIDGKPVWRRVVEKFPADRGTRLKWMSCLAKNSAVDWNAKDANGHTALHYAVTQGDTEFVRLLKKNGAKSDVGIASQKASGMTALHGASEIDDQETRKQIARSLFSSQEVDMEVRDSRFGLTPLATAALLKRSDLVRLYLKHGASVDAKDNDGNTPLFLAVKSGSRNSVIELLSRDNGRTINTKNGQGDTPLCWATRNKKYNLVRTLLVNGNINIQLSGAGGKTPVQCLLDNADTESLDIVSRLDVADIRNPKELFDTAVKNKKYSAAKFLFDIALTDEERRIVERTTLMPAVKSGDVKLVESLTLCMRKTCDSNMQQNYLYATNLVSSSNKPWYRNLW